MKLIPPLVYVFKKDTIISRDRFISENISVFFVLQNNKASEELSLTLKKNKNKKDKIRFKVLSRCVRLIHFF